MCATFRFFHAYFTISLAFISVFYELSFTILHRNFLFGGCFFLRVSSFIQSLRSLVPFHIVCFFFLIIRWLLSFVKKTVFTTQQRSLLFVLAIYPIYLCTISDGWWCYCCCCWYSVFHFLWLFRNFVFALLKLHNFCIQSTAYNRVIFRYSVQWLKEHQQQHQRNADEKMMKIHKNPMNYFVRGNVIIMCTFFITNVTNGFFTFCAKEIKEKPHLVHWEVVTMACTINKHVNGELLFGVFFSFLFCLLRFASFRFSSLMS